MNNGWIIVTKEEIIGIVNILTQQFVLFFQNKKSKYGTEAVSLMLPLMSWKSQNVNVSNIKVKKIYRILKYLMCFVLMKENANLLKS